MIVLGISTVSKVQCIGPPFMEQRGTIMDRDTLIERYFWMGISYLEIICFLFVYHGIRISIRQLKRILRSRNLARRNQQSRVNAVVDAIENELQMGNGTSVGYRLMHQKICSSYGLVVDRETVRLALKALDPEGVQRRLKTRLRRCKYQANGPNFLWHIDRYDKLKPFGFCTHGAIDGYSRRIMWLEVDHSNKKKKQPNCHSQILLKDSA